MGTPIPRGDLFLAHAETEDLTHVDLVYGPEVMKESWFGSQLGGMEFDAVERRLDEIFPHGHGLTLALEELRLVGLIDAVDEDNFELSERLKNCAEPVASFVAAWEDPDNRIWLGSLINDWPAAYEAARFTEDALARTIAPRAERCREQRCGLLREQAAASGLTPGLLYELAAAGASELPAYLEEALREPTELSAAALDLIRDDASWRPQVCRFSLSLSRASERFSETIAERSAGYLVEHGHDAREVIQTLGSCLAMPGQAAVLALRHRPGLAIPLVRSSLRGLESTREMVAAALAVVDQPWSRRELAAILDESDRPEETLHCRLALRESRSYEARLAAEGWERENLGPSSDTTPGRGGEFAGPPPSASSDWDERVFRRRMEELRPLLSEVESPTPFGDMLDG